MAKRKNKSRKTPPSTTQVEETDNDSNPLGQESSIPQYTLLEIPGRVDFPPIPNRSRPCHLIEIATENPDLYKNLITLIRHGVAGHVAAESIGVNQNTFYDWAKRGRQETAQDPIDPPDTFYTRFFNDVRRAVAIKRSEVDMEKAASDPRRWLSNGPGKIFGNNWADNPTTKIENDPSNDPLLIEQSDSPSSPSENSSSDSSDPNSTEVIEGKFEAIRIDESTTKNALEVLEEQGIIEVPRSFKAQVNKQSGE